MTARTFCMLVVLTGAASLARADIYRWVDDRGSVHYSESLPPGRTGEKISAPPPSTSVPPTGKSDRLEQQEREFQQRQRKEQLDEQLRKAEAQQREARCLQAKRELQRLTMDLPLYRIDKYGERVYMEDSEREAATIRIKAAIKENCSP